MLQERDVAERFFSALVARVRKGFHIKHVVKSISIVSLILAGVQSVLAQGECPGQHCSAKAQIVNQMCINLGQKGGVVFVEHQGSYCWCKCSCLASNTPVATDSSAWKPIGELKVGDTVLALQSDNSWKKAPVVFSDGTTMPEKPFPYAVYISTASGTSIVVTADHLFLMPDGSLKRADRLAPSDKLVDAALKPTNITALVAGSYHGPIHHIAATRWDGNVTKDGHLINTSGVISGDYFVELYMNQPALLSDLQVGSSEYEKKYGEMLGIKDLKTVIDLGGKAKFIPGRKFMAPPEAVPFLPPGQDIAAAGKLQPLDYTIPYEMAEYLVNHYKRFYPEVVFHIEWFDDRVNAFAWREGSVKHVAILGGLLRHVAIQQEGAGLVLAHELGHHYGGPPFYPNSPLSCEGQSDYWGALVAERNVWWGHYALQQIQAGSQQLYNLFAFGLLVGNLFEVDAITPRLQGICTHPPAQCRLDTYLAAMRLDPKPSCAGIIGK
jgi:hypothetical protein